MERAGVRVDPKALETMSKAMEKEVRAGEGDLGTGGLEFNVNSPTHWLRFFFDKLNLQPPARRGKGKVRSTAADILEEMAGQHALPGKVDRVPRDRQTEIDLR